MAAPSASPSASQGEDVLGSLVAVFESIPDPRRKNRRHSLSALMCGLVVAFCSGCNAMKHVVVFLHEESALRGKIGFTHEKSPSQSTYCRLFAALDAGVVLDGIRSWLGALASARIAARRHGELAAAVDGKTARGTGEHSVYVFMHDFWLLLDMFEAGKKDNEFTAFESRLQEILERYPFLSIFTMDALYAQHALASALTAKGKRTIFQVKGNQKETLQRMRRFFARLPQDSPDRETVEKKWGLCRHEAPVGTKCSG